MTYRGTVKGGTIVLDAPVALPEGTIVQVEPLEDHPLMALARLAEDLPANPDWPADGASELEHYLYGTPKREQ